MSTIRSLLGRPGVEATFVPGRPARTGRLALWVPGSTPASFTDALDLVLPTDGSVRQQTVPVTLVDVADAIDPLIDLGAAAVDGGPSASVRAWSAATHGALHLLARGRILPAIDEDGLDAWRLGPFDADDLAALDDLARALPPAAHASAVAGTAPRRVASPRWLVARWWDAVADAYVRTAGASVAAGHEAFAARERSVLVRTDVLVAGAQPLGTDLAAATWGGAEGTGWLPSTAAADASDLTVALRLEDAPTAERGPAPDDGAFRAVVEVASVADRSLVLDAADLWAAPEAVASRFGPHAADAVLLALRRGARAWAPLARLLDDARPAALDLDGAEVDELLGPAASALAAVGLEVRWPTELLAPVRLEPVVASTALDADRTGTLSLSSLCELRWRASVDGEQLTEEELAQLVQAKRGVVRLRGRWVRADPAKLARADQRRRITGGEALAVALSGELLVDGEEVAAAVEGPLAALGERLRRAEGREAWRPPAALRAELRPYQRAGAAWLAEMADLGLGGVLADDMGLGKTVQLLALHLDRHRPGAAATGPTLVICPVSVLTNWAREAARFAPGIPVVRHHGSTRALGRVPDDALVLTTYGVARRDAARLAAVGWGIVAADEAQAIKNPRSRTARALRTIPAGARFALTGTPVENRLVDLWALLDWTTPGLLGSLERFRREVAVPVERDRDPDAAAALARLVRPFLLRRRKADPAIAPELPPKTETDHVVPLTTEQATLYRATVEEILEQVEGAEGMARRGLVLKLLTSLKQICNHPAQHLGQDGPLAGRSGKLDAVAELVDTIVAEGEAVLVFTQYVVMGHLLAAHLGPDGRPAPFLHGATSAAARQRLVDEFQAGATPVFIVSLKAGGTGLNLTRATHVVHYDRWWNPAVEDQASDRAWRIGQDRPVQVHRMICEGTVEDRIAALLADKRSLADAVVTAGEGWISELDDEALRTLVSLGADEAGP